MADGQLLERFLQRHDHAAFEQLVRVHGPLVYGVCQRILMNHHDAEEAFQATFLVLARKAKSLTGRPSVAGWLHEAAQRTALNARRLRAQRRVREQAVQTVPEPAAKSRDQWPEIAPLLDQELSRLPEKYRVPILLCDLEGKSQDAAAAELGCSRGTLSSRLVRARALLQQRLSRLGVTISMGSLAAMLSQQAASASVPAALLASTVQMATVWTTSSAAAGALSPQVAALTEGVMKTMFYAQLKKVVLVAAMMVFAGVGAGGLAYQMHAAESAAKQQDVVDRLQGRWKAVKVEHRGGETPEAKVKSMMMTLTFTGTKFISTAEENMQQQRSEGSLKIDVTKKPYEMDWTNIARSINGAPLANDNLIALMGAFELDGDVLKIRMVSHVDGKDPLGNPVSRPTDLAKTQADDAAGDILMTLQRDKP